MQDSAIAGHVHDAIRQVRDLRRRVLEAERFTGYSGQTRVVGGVVALLAALVMSRAWYPRSVDAHLIGWAIVAVIAAIGNYSALLVWFFFNPRMRPDIRRLVPTVDALPPLFVGGVLTASLILTSQFDLLFGAWMCLYGLANLSSRRVLPRAMWPLGAYYILAGCVFLFWPGVSFTSPWGMGLVFFLGEVAGGFIFHYNRKPDAPFSSFFAGGA